MINTAGGISFSSSSSGVTLNDERPRHKLFKITSGTNPYAALEVFLDDSDGTTDDAARLEFAAATKMLWELRGNASVPANTYVVAHPNPDSDGWVFVYEAGVGAGAGDYCTNSLSNVCPIYAWIKLDGGVWEQLSYDPADTAYQRVVVGIKVESVDCETGVVTCSEPDAEDCCYDTTELSCCEGDNFLVPDQFTAIILSPTGAIVGETYWPASVTGTWTPDDPETPTEWTFDTFGDSAWLYSVDITISCIETGYRVTVSFFGGGDIDIPGPQDAMTVTGLNGWTADGATVYKEFGCTAEWNPDESIADLDFSGGGDPADDWTCTFKLT
jgi:hypothetical protein